MFVKLKLSSICTLYNIFFMLSSGLVNAFGIYFRLIILALLEDIKIFTLLFIEFTIPNPSFVYLKYLKPLCLHKAGYSEQITF